MNKDQPHGFRTDWRSFNIASLDISLYHPAQENFNLAGICYWLSGRYQECIVNLGDTLHRHNLFGKENAHRESYDLGSQWISRNKKYLSWFSIPYKIVRHDDWRFDPEFDPIYKALWSFYYRDSTFNKVIEEDVNCFLERQNNIPRHEAYLASRNYLLEELAADILLGKRQRVAHFYPAWRQKCYGHLVQRTDELPDILKGLENSAFKRYSPGKLSIEPAGFNVMQKNKERATA